MLPSNMLPTLCQHCANMLILCQQVLTCCQHVPHMFANMLVICQKKCQHVGHVPTCANMLPTFMPTCWSSCFTTVTYGTLIRVHSILFDCRNVGAYVMLIRVQTASEGASSISQIISVLSSPVQSRLFEYPFTMYMNTHISTIFGCLAAYNNFVS